MKRIRIHDLRHSHISLLIDMGFSAVAIADRELVTKVLILLISTHTSFRQSRLRWQKKLDDLGKGDFENVS